MNAETRHAIVAQRSEAYTPCVMTVINQHGEHIINVFNNTMQLVHYFAVLPNFNSQHTDTIYQHLDAWLQDGIVNPMPFITTVLRDVQPAGIADVLVESLQRYDERTAAQNLQGIPAEQAPLASRLEQTTDLPLADVNSYSYTNELASHQSAIEDRPEEDVPEPMDLGDMDPTVHIYTDEDVMLPDVRPPQTPPPGEASHLLDRWEKGGLLPLSESPHSPLFQSVASPAPAPAPAAVPTAVPTMASAPAPAPASVQTGHPCPFSGCSQRISRQRDIQRHCDNKHPGYTYQRQ